MTEDNPNEQRLKFWVRDKLTLLSIIIGGTTHRTLMENENRTYS